MAEKQVTGRRFYRGREAKGTETRKEQLVSQLEEIAARKLSARLRFELLSGVSAAGIEELKAILARSVNGSSQRCADDQS